MLLLIAAGENGVMMEPAKAAAGEGIEKKPGHPA